MKISREEFISIVRENSINFDGDNIQLNDKLSDLGIDSLGFVTTLHAIEERTEIVTNEKYLGSLVDMDTVSDLVLSFKSLGVEIEI